MSALLIAFFHLLGYCCWVIRKLLPSLSLSISLSVYLQFQAYESVDFLSLSLTLWSSHFRPASACHPSGAHQSHSAARRCGGSGMQGDWNASTHHPVEERRSSRVHSWLPVQAAGLRRSADPLHQGTTRRVHDERRWDGIWFRCIIKWIVCSALGSCATSAPQVFNMGFKYGDSLCCKTLIGRFFNHLVVDKEVCLAQWRLHLHCAEVKGHVDDKEGERQTQKRQSKLDSQKERESWKDGQRDIKREGERQREVKK